MYVKQTRAEITSSSFTYYDFCHILKFFWPCVVLNCTTVTHYCTSLFDMLQLSQYSTRHRLLLCSSVMLSPVELKLRLQPSFLQSLISRVQSGASSIVFSIAEFAKQYTLKSIIGTHHYLINYKNDLFTVLSSFGKFTIHIINIMPK